MCKFVSGIILKTGEIVCEPEFTDSHEDLLKMAGIVENQYATGSEYFARFEFTPPEDLKTVSDLSTWKLKVDEGVIACLYNAEPVLAYCERKVRSMIVTTARNVVFGGGWIFDGIGGKERLVSWFEEGLVCRQTAPTFAAPTFPAPTFPAPTFTAPTFPAPTFTAPTFTAPTFTAPTFTAPTFAAPTFPAPTFPAPTFTAPT